MTPDYFRETVIIEDICSIIGNYPQIWDQRLNTNLDLFYGFNIFQTNFLKFMKNSIDNNCSFIIITNLQNLYNDVTYNINNLKIHYFNYPYNNNNFSIKIPLTNCWKIPSVPINSSLSHFYSTLDINLNNDNTNFIILSFEDYIHYLKLLDNMNLPSNLSPVDNILLTDSNPTGSSQFSVSELSVSLQLKQLLSDIIFDEKDNMTDNAFKSIMEKISAL